MSEVYDARQVAKRRAALYRTAAAKMVGVAEHPYGAVNPMHDGAFVEVVVWVSLSAIEPPAESVTEQLKSVGSVDESSSNT